MPTASQVYAKLSETREQVAVDHVDVAEKTQALATSQAALAGSERQAKIAKAVAVATFKDRPFFDSGTGTLISVVEGELVSSVPYGPDDETASVEVDIDGDGQPDNVEPPAPPVE